MRPTDEHPPGDQHGGHRGDHERDQVRHRPRKLCARGRGRGGRRPPRCAGTGRHQ
jgi:hypothetical protein